MISDFRFKYIRRFLYLLSSSIALVPLIAFAQREPRTLQDLIARFVEILSALIPLLFGIALIGFLWGVALTVLNAGSEEKRKEGKQIIMWGIIGLFVMTAIWGIVIAVGGTFGIRFASQVQTPKLPTSGAQQVIDQFRFLDFSKKLDEDRALPLPPLSPNFIPDR